MSPKGRRFLVSCTAFPNQTIYMKQTTLSTGCAFRVPAKPRLVGTILFSAALVFLVTSAGCARGNRSNFSSPELRATVLHRIAENYANTSDLDAARSALADTQLANPAQLLISLAEQDINEGRPPDEVQQVADLAAALGARSPMVFAYLEPTATPSDEIAIEAPTATVEPPTVTATVPPPATATVQAATATNAPPVKPRVTARDAVNLRGGPGTAYPVVGQMKPGSALDILGRNASGDWWRVAYPTEEQAWVASLLVDVTGAIDNVTMVGNIPAPPAVVVAAPTAAPAPTQAPVAQEAPKPTAKPQAPPGMQFLLKGFRLRPVGEGAQQCGGGDHNINVYIQDAAGNPLDGVNIREVWTNSVRTSGAKGPGMAQWDIYRGGGGQVVVVDGAGNAISETTPGMSDDWPPFELMKAAGYCNCKPEPDDAACIADINNKNFHVFPIGHFVYEVTYQRAN